LEKNLPAFLDLAHPGRKVVVGDGPLLEEYRAKYPDVEFVGPKFGKELVRYFGSASVLVFPSRTDTFGLVMVEALACGLPVAAYPVPGPIDVIQSEAVGALDEDLEKAVAKALTLDPKKCREYALNYSWENACRQFAQHLLPPGVVESRAPRAS
jgi:glycosyltransferase involved in cell wall biosynthesis